MAVADRILVTGSQGFLGSHIVARGKSLGRAMVPTCRGASRGEALQLDVCDPQSVEEAFRRILPSTVIHCASYGVNYADQDPDLAMKVNICGSLRVLESAARYGTKRVVHIGSCFEYGDQAGPISEGAPLNPTAIYGATKAAVTLLLRERAKGLGIDLMVLRPFGMWGPGEPRHRLIPQVVEACLDGRPLKLTACEILRDYTYVEDMAEKILALATLPQVARGMVINVGSGRGVQLRDFVLSVARVLKGEQLMHFGQLAYRPTEMMSLVADVEQSRRLLGASREILLADGVNRMVTSLVASRSPASPHSVAYDVGASPMRTFAESVSDNPCERPELPLSEAKEVRPGRQLLSIVVPCYNEEEVIGETVKRLTLLCTQIADLDVELIFVNNDSSDSTWTQLKRFAEREPRIKLISLARNFGYQISTTAGIDAARGDAVVIMDADLQDPPELVVEMIGKWREGYDVVYGTRSTRLGESPLRMLITSWFYRLLNRISDVPIPLDTGDFRLMSRNVVNTLKAMPERDRFIRGMVSWIGFRQTAIPYRRAERFAGESKFPWSSLFSFAFDGITSFSTAPLRICAALGLFCASLALFGILYALYIRLFTDTQVEGWAALMISVLFVGGVQLLSLGILGEYIGRIYNESKHRPLYVAREYVGFDQGGPAMSRSPVVNSK